MYNSIFALGAFAEFGRRRSPVPLKALLGAVAMLACLSTAALAKDWPMFGQNPGNTASTVNSGITTTNVGNLAPKWTFTTGGDVSARAAVVNGVVYFPDWGGNLWAVNATTGIQVWGGQLSKYVPGIGTVHSRTSPAVVDGVVYVGTQEGAYLLAINAVTGTLLWKTQLEKAANAIITSSPAVSNGFVYTGVASLSEGASLYKIDLSTTTSRGSAVAVNAKTGEVKWKTYTVPENFQGGGVWGSNPVVDTVRQQLVVGTGNNYTSVPDGSGNHEDSILALDLNTGDVKWATKLVTWTQAGVSSGSDSWNVDCFFSGPQCPANPGPDFDFGSAPNLITYKSAGVSKTIIGAGQKSGIYYALDPATGTVLWHTQVGPGSALGGMEWGSASDGSSIYVQISNLYGLPNGFKSDGTTPNYAGAWAALNPANGNIIWKTADPNGGIDIGPMTVADGVVFASSMASVLPGTTIYAPNMFALDGATGSPIWSYAAGASVNDGAAVVNGVVYWGAGYTHLGIAGFTGINKFYAFSVNGN